VQSLNPERQTGAVSERKPMLLGGQKEFSARFCKLHVERNDVEVGGARKTDERLRRHAALKAFLQHLGIVDRRNKGPGKGCVNDVRAWLLVDNSQ
jgi:hypothetical protein